MALINFDTLIIAVIMHKTRLLAVLSVYMSIKMVYWVTSGVH
ncbi:MAG: hypothetical protein PHP74_03365 [Candidatus Gracilibacteria bacterium]|nr:hypothetical protein [Candidatus Gracilibacteria bacterium]